MGPVLEVARRVELSLVLGREHHHHDPEVSGCVPEDFGIAEILFVHVEYRVARKFGPGSAIVAESEVLRLQLARVAGPDGSDAFTIQDGTAREDHSAVRLANCGGEFLPVDEIAAYGVPPSHVP